MIPNINPNMILDSSLQRVWIARLRTSNEDYSCYTNASIATGQSHRRCFVRPSSALDGRPPPKARPGGSGGPPGDLIRKMLK